MRLSETSDYHTSLTLSEDERQSLDGSILPWLGKAIQEFSSQNQPAEESDVSQEQVCLSITAVLGHCLEEGHERYGRSAKAAMDFRGSGSRPLGCYGLYSWRSAVHSVATTLRLLGIGSVSCYQL